jgi:hypothetical protein
MANIRVDLDYPIVDGQPLTFKAPCPCSEIEGLKVYYPIKEGTTFCMRFVFKDAHGIDLTNVENLFDANAYVKVILNTKERVAYLQNADTNGYLEDRFNVIEARLNDELEQNSISKSAEQGWRVKRDHDYVCAFQQFAEEMPLTDLQLNNVHLGYISDTVKRILPYPIEDSVINVVPDSNNGIQLSSYIDNKCVARYKCLFLSDSLMEQIKCVNGITVHGIRAKPPANPLYSSSEKGKDVVAVAKSYHDARLAGRKFSYGENFITYQDSKVVNDFAGRARMECDTLLSLVMLGIPYEKSPYADTSENLKCNFEDLRRNPNNYSWCLPWRYDGILKRKVTYTGAQNFYFWYNNCVFKNVDKVDSGDVVIFTKPNSPYFDGVSHVGIIDNRDGEPWVYHITGMKTISPMMHEPLSNVVARGGYDMDTQVYFARPNYA